MSFGARLKVERKRLKLTQAAAAELGGVYRLSWHGYENDIRLPDVEFLMRLKDAKFDVHFLMFNERLGAAGRASRPSAELLAAVYRAVDEFAISDSGDALPLEERVRLFNFLCDDVLSAPEIVAPAEMQQRLARYSRS